MGTSTPCRSAPWSAKGFSASCLTGEAAWSLQHCRVPLLQCVRISSLLLDTDSVVHALDLSLLSEEDLLSGRVHHPSCDWAGLLCRAVVGCIGAWNLVFGGGHAHRPSRLQYVRVLAAHHLLVEDEAFSHEEYEESSKLQGLARLLITLSCELTRFTPKPKVLQLCLGFEDTVTPTGRSNLETIISVSGSYPDIAVIGNKATASLAESVWLITPHARLAMELGHVLNMHVGVADSMPCITNMDGPSALGVHILLVLPTKDLALGPIKSS